MKFEHTREDNRRTEIMVIATLQIPYTVKISAVYPRIFVASFPYCNGTGSVHVCIRKSTEQEAFEKCWAHSPLRAVLNCHSPGVATCRLRIDVYNDDNDNA